MAPLRTTLAIMVLLVSASLALAQKSQDTLPPAPEGKTWKLAWHDEFDGTKLDESKWDIPEYKRVDGYWSRKAISLDGKGHLVMSVLKEGDKYLDGCVRTKGKFEHTFGYYVARIQLQKQPGHWTAFWLYNVSVSKDGNDGRQGTEIDIYEKPWLDERVQQTLHWGGYGQHHKSSGNVAKVPGIMEGWHTFGLWWKPDEYVFYVDGRETWRTKAGGVCQVPLYIKLSDEIGPWGGDIRKAKLPDQFLVDYVRVYDLAEKEAPATTAETRTIAGWTVHVSRSLLTQEPKATARALELTEKQLLHIIRAVPPLAVVELKKVPLYFSPEYPGVKPRAEYHPDAGWLREHGRDPGMAKGVEFTNVRIFEAETLRMPVFVLHELAHAYHDQVLGFDNPEVKAAYERAKASGKYDNVERWNGPDKPKTHERAYAMENEREYFAESTEAFFGRNDFFPFTPEELKKYDPETYALLERLWNFRSEKQPNPKAKR